MRRGWIALAAVTLSALALLASRDAAAGCTSDSTAIIDSGTGFIVGATLTDPAPCGEYLTAHSRFAKVCADSSNADTCEEVLVSVPYTRHMPTTGNVHAVVVLLAGGDGETSMKADICIQDSKPYVYPPAATPNAPCTKPVNLTQTGKNFLVRSAQLIADAGFKVLTIGRPSPVPAEDIGKCGLTAECYELYRMSQRHAVDIAAVVQQENQAVRPVFLVGTSRGAISAVAQNALGSGILLSSPVTSTTTGLKSTSSCGDDHRPFVDDCFYTQLKPSAVTVPVQILMHVEDADTVHHPACTVARYADAQALASHISSNGLGLAVHFVSVPAPAQPNGGFEVVDKATGVVVDACGAQSFHGFLGMETQAANRITNGVHRMLNDIKSAFGADNAPVSTNPTLTLTVTASGGGTLIIDLSTAAMDADGDTLSFALPAAGAKSARGAALTFSGSTQILYDGSSFATLEPGTIHDSFAYVTSDGKGRKSVGIVRVTVTVQ